MLYFDTSFLAPLIFPEATSQKIARFVRRLAVEEFTVSHWTRVEFSSLIAREVRIGGLDVQAASMADAQFEAMLQESFSILLPKSDDFDLAKHFLGRFETGLRAGDALHLAVANNHRAAAIYSLNKKLVKAGKILGLPVRMGVRINRPQRR